VAAATDEMSPYDGTLTSATFTLTDNGIRLDEAADNSPVLTKKDGQQANVSLTRTLQEGGWNTFAVPFNLDTPAGWTVKELISSTFAYNTLTLNFDDASSIVAGKPYLVKVDAKAENPAFNGVTISSTAMNTETTYADFVPVMKPTFLTGEDKTVLFVAGGNTLTYPTADGNINGFRAYFQLKGDAATARTFRMDFGTGETTAIDGAEANSSLFTLHPSCSEWYTLDGRKLSAEPTQKGVYIVNGKKIVIK
jgi:hypothetical protein